MLLDHGEEVGMQNHVLCYGRSTNCYVDAIQRSCDVHVTLNEVLWRVCRTSRF